MLDFDFFFKGKNMFKSVFSKYVSAFMIIILLSFIVVVVITSSAIGHYSKDVKEDIMTSSAEAAAAYISDRLESSGNELSSMIESDNLAISDTVDKILVTAEDVTLLITDASGKLLLRAGSDANRIEQSQPIPDEVLKALREKGEYSRFGSSSGMLKHSDAVCAVTLKDGDGNLCGFIFTCSETITMVGLWEVVVRIVMGSIIWVLLAALIAVYFISERVIAPLREISSAAKRFASGKFDTRVMVRGSDEVAELAVAFNNMAESLDNYDNMRNTFMSDVSHDLRSPMTSISGFIDGILDGVIPPEKHEYYLQIVSSEIKRLSRLVSTLLDLSRIQAGERKFNMTDFDICEMARQILISFEQKINAKGLDISFDISEDKIGVNADSDAIYQVLYNLCDNAVKFSSEGGKLSITISRIKGRRVLVEIYNEGSGISPADINYVFERFYKSDKSRGLNKSGAGLGLFISKTIMDAHGQKIWVESEYGKNCCFRFTLDAE